MNKRYLLIFTIIAFLLIGCEMDIKNMDPSVETASVTLSVKNAKGLRTILPEETEIKSYTVTLINNASSSVSYSKNFSADSTIEFESVLVGSYTITVDGYSDESNTTKVATGSTELSVTADGTNAATVSLDWLSEGKGSFSVTIDWKELTKEDNIIYKAINNRSLGFEAWDTDNKKAYSTAEIQWAGDDDFSSKEFTYTQSDIDKGTTNISFRIYSNIDGEDQVIAETFYTSVTIFTNITSTPDANDSFSLNNNNIVYYLKNVTGVTATLNSEDSGKKIDISWEYPLLNDGNYLLKIWLTNNDNNDSVVGDVKSISYSVENKTATGDKSITFDGLDPQYTYSVHLINYTNDESLVYSYSAEIIPLEDIRTKVKVTSVSFEANFASSYTMGDSVAVGAIITPADATYKDYTVSADEGVKVESKTLSFPSAGDYAITITSDDDSTISATKTVTVKLSTPQAFTLEKTAEGMALSWGAVQSATSYSIEKTYNGETETLTSTTNSYTDSDVKTGVEYTYKVKAVKNNDSKFDSAYTEEKTERITNTFITVTVPANITSENFKSVLETALTGQFVTDLKGITVTIDTSSSTLLSSTDTTFSWLLNGKEIGEKNSKSVDIDTSNVDISSTESANTLQLLVTNNGTTYSASTTVHYIEVDPGNVTITVPEDVSYIKEEVKVVYGSPVSLTAKTENYDNAIILWSSSNPSVATVDSNGVVTSLLDGSVEITATIVATGKNATKTIKSYIPVGKIEITQSSTNWLAIKKSGVDITNDNYRNKTLTATVTGANGVEWGATDKTLTWSTSSNTNSVSLSSTSGNKITVTSSENGNAGTPTITVEGADGKFKSITVPVYDFNVYHNSKSKMVAGGEAQMTESASYPENKMYIVVNNTILENSTNAELRKLASYSWAYNPSQKTSFKHSESTYYAIMSFGVNCLNCGVTVTITDNETSSVVGKITFKRVGK